jgi:hypothetical protein
MSKQTTRIPAETELVVVKKNSDGTVHVRWKIVEADVPADDLTNDRDWLLAYRNLHPSGSR